MLGFGLQNQHQNTTDAQRCLSGYAQSAEDGTMPLLQCCAGEGRSVFENPKLDRPKLSDLKPMVTWGSPNFKKPPCGCV